MSVGAEKFSFLLVCALVIELFIVALILADCFMSLLLRHYHQYFAIVISSPIIPLAFYFLQKIEECSRSKLQLQGN